MKIQLLKDFKKIKRVAGIKTNILKAHLETNQNQNGSVFLEDDTVLGCVNMYYQIKCKSSNCYLIQKEIGVAKEVGQAMCSLCHLRFLEQYEQGKIKIKKNK